MAEEKVTRRRVRRRVQSADDAPATNAVLDEQCAAAQERDGARAVKAFEGAKGPADVLVERGTQLTVSWPEETFQAVQYESFRVGGLSITGTVKDGETVAQCYGRMWKILEALAADQFKEKLSGFRSRHAEVHRAKG